jgi:hypothetical protein
MLVDVNTTTQTESVIMEVDGSGNVLKTWNLATIISAAMTAGGDDPTQFVYPSPTDWFHNNAVTYRRSDNSLVVSSRENFVICLDYETGAIKWILVNQKYQFPSLVQYALRSVLYSSTIATRSRSRRMTVFCFLMMAKAACFKPQSEPIGPTARPASITSTFKQGWPRRTGTMKRARPFTVPFVLAFMKIAH